MNSLASSHDLLLAPPFLWVIATGILTGLLYFWSTLNGSPLIAIALRWVRWLFVALAAGNALHVFLLPEHPLWVCIAVAFLGWFLLETAYLWLAVTALSRSEIPLFPPFQKNEKEDEWPSHPRFIKLKSALKATGFKRIEALFAPIHQELALRMVVFANPEHSIRVSVLFFPNGKSQLTECFLISSHLTNGRILTTDNFFLPFGGFYPDSWQLERLPLVRDFRALFRRHQERIDAAATPLQPIEASPLQQAIDDQRAIERINRDLGFLNPHDEIDECGRLSPAGKARVWQEIWTLSYFGKPLRYS